MFRIASPKMIFSDWRLYRTRFATIIILSLTMVQFRESNSVSSSSHLNYSSQGNFSKIVNSSLGFEDGKTWDVKQLERSRNETLSGSRGRTRCRNGNICNTYVQSWSYFYLKIGGWLMLGIVLVGISCLIITHYLGMKKANTDRRKKKSSRLTWTDAKTRSTLAKWI